LSSYPSTGSGRTGGKLLVVKTSFSSHRARPELVEGYPRALENLHFNPIFTSFLLGTH